MKLIVQPQRYIMVAGHNPLTYGIFWETDEQFDGLHYWQGVESPIFICYSRTPEGAARAIEFLTEETR